MTNLEYYRKELENITSEGNKVALYKGKPVCCSEIYSCKECGFRSAKCSVKLTQWLLAERITEPTITSKEKMLLEVMNCKYIARDKNGGLYAYCRKPEKTERTWSANLGSWICIDKQRFEVSFPFIKWEDEEPWAVEDLLKLEVADD